MKANLFVIVPKPYGVVCLSLCLTRLNQALIGPARRSPATNDIVPKLSNVC